MNIRSKQTNKLIETINVLGPWVHGYFELDCGITIKDNDLYQRARLFQLRDALIRIIGEHFDEQDIQGKTLCDVGCNTGYFLFELYKRFGFKAAKGYDPRKTNVDKARFIAKQFKLPAERYSVSVGNVYNLRNKKFDIVMMPGVMHHLDDHILACKRLYDMTGELLILESMALPDAVESPDMAKYLELKDDIYKHTKPIFGVSGLKLESEYLDGATATSGIVTIPSRHSIYLSLFNAGFRDITLYDTSATTDSLEATQPKYRDFCNILAVAKKPRQAPANFFEDHTLSAQQGEIGVVVPLEIIEPLYRVVEGQIQAQTLSGEARDAWFGLVRPDGSAPSDTFADRAYLSILRSLAHQPVDKIRFEYAKTLFHAGEHVQAARILRTVILTMNCDWRSVYRSCHVLSLIAKAEGRLAEARRFNAKTLKAHPNFFPAKQLQEQLR